MPPIVVTCHYCSDMLSIVVACHYRGNVPPFVGGFFFKLLII